MGDAADCDRADAAEAEVERLTRELQNIALADPAGWPRDVQDQFKEWAQSRARAAIDAAIKAAKP
jgi:hypothetical protein